MRPTKGRLKNVLPALVMGAMVGSASVLALTNGMTPAYAASQPMAGIVDLVAQVSPAVVTIEVTKKAEAVGFNQSQLPDGFPFDEFIRRFGMPMPGMPGGRGGAMPEMQGMGTGFIVSADGQVVTNAHVVDGATTVKVTLSDGRTLDATVVGQDDATDIALLKVAAEGLPTVRFGDSTALKVGESVVAIGNPFGLGSTVTSGIVSALGRDINAGPFDDFIQTDAAINKGNSGGPLFNDAGEVVGINTAILSPTGGSVGVGFAVPSDLAKDVVADLAGDGTVARGWLGVQIQPVSEDIAAALGLDAAKGAMIQAVTDDTPAAKAGLKKGDIVLAVDGKAVDSPRDLSRLIAGDTPGTEVAVNLLRAGQPIDLSVTLGNRADQPA